VHVIEAVRRSGVGVSPGTTVGETASVMESSGVGSIVVIDDGRLVGVVTDRDLVRRELACGLPADARVDAVMSAPVITVDAHADARDALALFRDHGVRRLAVVRGGEFIGMVTVDDMLVEFSRVLAELTSPVLEEIEHAHHDAPLPVTR
jgi:CBS domain-containing protein